MSAILDDLEALARAATPGPWETYLGAYVVEAGRGPDVIDDTAESSFNADVYGWKPQDNAAYIAACSPERILALVAVARAAADLNVITGKTSPRGDMAGDLVRLRAALYALDALP